VAASRISRGFHRSGVFLGVLLFLISSVAAFFLAKDAADRELKRHEAMVCAFDNRPTTVSIDGVGRYEVKGLLKLSDVERQQKVREVVAWARKENDPLAKWDVAGLPKFEIYGEPASLTELDLLDLGCQSWSEKTTVQAAKEVRDQGYNYAIRLAQHFAFGLAISLAASLALYGLVRAIGWVIGGFAAA
jgi:hypothetical protein